MIELTTPLSEEAICQLKAGDVMPCCPVSVKSLRLENGIIEG